MRMPVGCSADGCRAAWAGLGGEGLVDTIVEGVCCSTPLLEVPERP